MSFGSDPMIIRKIVAGLGSGLLFGAGLAVAGMTDPNKVLNFLDLPHGWDPSLALVMIAAIPASAAAFAWARRRQRPWLEPAFVLPDRAGIDGQLVIGSALFGLGWGLAGYCPGPAIASLAQASPPLVGFLIAMALGLLLARYIARAVKPGDAPKP